MLHLNGGVPIDTLRLACPERRIVLLCVTRARPAARLWALERLERKTHAETCPHPQADQNAETEIDLTESFALAWRIVRLALRSTRERSKGHFRIRRRSIRP